jgi:hypothetical protein
MKLDVWKVQTLTFVERRTCPASALVCVALVYCVCALAHSLTHSLESVQICTGSRDRAWHGESGQRVCCS